MPEKIIEEFLLALASYGLAPAHPTDIQPSDDPKDYQLARDKRGKRKGFYRLKIDTTREIPFGFGYFGDWRNADFHVWHSKATKSLSENDKRALQRKWAQEKAEIEKHRQALADQAAAQAQDFTIFLENCPANHPYLEAKKVKPYGNILKDGNDIIIPLGNRDKIHLYQKIQPDGGKWCLPQGCKKDGSYFTLTGATDAVYICEGYSTAATVREITGQTTIMGIDAGNLPKIVEEIREIYPSSQIIIAADNDHETVDGKGTPNNKGMIEAKKTSDILGGCKIIAPPFTKQDENLSDWNDYCRKYGYDVTKQKLLGKPVEASGGAFPKMNGTPLAAGGDFLLDWTTELRLNGKGNIIPNSTVNAMLYISNHDQLKDVFKFDSFSKRAIVRSCPPWECEQTFQVRPIQDYDYIRLEAFLEFNFGLETSANACAALVNSVAMEQNNTFNPAGDYFRALQWDGIPRLDTWVEKYIADHTGGFFPVQPKEYLSLVGRKFLCGMAARAMSPGVKFDTMIILEGRQYAGKSFLARTLSTINGVEYFLDDFKDIENKDALMKMQGKLIVEFPEISTMRKAEVHDLKAFLSRTTDVFRPPYGRNTMESGRQCVFIGTVNPEGCYLRDITGNRRYLPIACRSEFNLEELKRIVPYLHAEAAHLVKQGEQLWFTDSEMKLCNTQQNARVVLDVWTDKISDILKGRSDIWTDQIFVELQISADKQNAQTQFRVNQAMIMLGWIPTVFMVAGIRKHGYKKTGGQMSFNEESTEEIPW